MGGGGGYIPLKPDQLKSLEKKAKETMKGGAQGEKKNVFISFDSGDLTDVNMLRAQAKNKASDLEFNDWSVKEPFSSKNAEYIRRGIRERIRQSSVTVVYLSNKTANSEWVNWEISESHAQGKGVVAMYKGDRSPVQLPSALKKLGIKPVPWNHEAIVEAIDKATK